MSWSQEAEGRKEVEAQSQGSELSQHLHDPLYTGSCTLGELCRGLGPAL